MVKRPRVGDHVNGQRLVAVIETWCRDCKGWRRHSMWRVLIGGRANPVEAEPGKEHHMLHCQVCGLERRLERVRGGVTEIVAPPAARKAEA